MIRQRIKERGWRMVVKLARTEIKIKCLNLINQFDAINGWTESINSVWGIDSKRINFEENKRTSKFYWQWFIMSYYSGRWGRRDCPSFGGWGMDSQVNWVTSKKAMKVWCSIKGSYFTSPRANGIASSMKA